MATKNQGGKNTIEAKKAIVRELGFHGLMHIPPMRVPHKLLKELANSFKLGKNTLETSYGSFKVKASTIGAALGLNVSVDSSSESESEEDSEEPKRKQLTRMAKKAQSKKRKHVVEDLSPEQTQSYDGKKGGGLRSTEGHYDSSETMPEVNLGSENDPLSQGQTDQSSINKPTDIMLSLVEESANDPAQQNMMVVRMETHSQPEALSIVPIQVYIPLSQTTPVPAIEPSPAKSPRQKISKERTKSTPQPLKPDEICYMSTRNNPAPKDAAALMMMARTAFYIPKEGPMPSFSLALTDSSQEEALMQEGHGQPGAQKAKMGKSPPIEKQCTEEIFEKFETLVKSKEMLAEIKEKCYVWATRVKTYGDGSTNEYDPVCTLKAQDRFILSKVHFASLKAATHIEAEIVTAVCLILNQQNVKRFQEEIYCLLPDIVNMAIENHPDGKFLHPKSKKPFKVEDYPMFIPFLDLKKLASHQYSIGGYGWLT
ncbi:uncharacterized protein DS421_19g647840 [Arachis hypogaea]|uniref:Uncharacterized protein n=1 Tax=Arachis hypogaea TaxID=3818 RepID=A0A6B9V9B8_ARAHY|nr:uncharacterized protein DS421_19g647840 [Arachis hypogaea]